MPFEFKLPDVGEGITEGEVVKWLVKEGDSVKEDQTIVQVETDKAVVDLPAPRAGTVLKLFCKEGETIKVGSTLVTIGDASEKTTSKSETKKIETKTSKKIEEKETKSTKGKSVVGQLEEAPDEPTEKEQAHMMRGPSQSAKVLAAPVVRELAAQQGIDLLSVKGSGEGGRVLKSDIPGTTSVPMQRVPITKSYVPDGYVERFPLKGIRKAIADAMTRSRDETAPVTAMEDIVVSKLGEIREREKKILEKKGIKLTLLPFILKATLAALKENPMLNSSIEGEEIIVKKYYNIGVAVETQVGLMVPVIKKAEDKTITELAQEITRLSESARARTIAITDMQGGTFTVTNYGSVGGTYATPIINPGEGAILGLGRIFDRLVMDDKGKLKNVKVLPVSLTFDHRIIDGAQAARFLESLKLFIEDPDHLLLELH